MINLQIILKASLSIFGYIAGGIYFLKGIADKLQTKSIKTQILLLSIYQSAIFAVDFVIISYQIPGMALPVPNLIAVLILTFSGLYSASLKGIII